MCAYVPYKMGGLHFFEAKSEASKLDCTLCYYLLAACLRSIRYCVVLTRIYLFVFEGNVKILNYRSNDRSIISGMT